MNILIMSCGRRLWLALDNALGGRFGAVWRLLTWRETEIDYLTRADWRELESVNRRYGP